MEVNLKQNAEQAAHTLSQRVITITHDFHARENYHMAIRYRIEIQHQIPIFIYFVEGLPICFPYLGGLGRPYSFFNR